MRFDKKQQRAAFEKWAKSLSLDLSSCTTDIGIKIYANAYVAAAWTTWQVAIEQVSQHKAFCDCGDSIEPDTGAVCGNCASETQSNLERLIEAEQASQPQVDKYRQALEFIADNADMRGEALASIAGEALNGN